MAAQYLNLTFGLMMITDEIHIAAMDVKFCIEIDHECTCKFNMIHVFLNMLTAQNLRIETYTSENYVQGEK